MKVNVKKSLAGMTVLLTFGAVLGYLSHMDNNKLLAKPDDGSPIVIDKGTNFSKEIPFDGLPLFEPELLETYGDYIQGKGVVSNLSKEVIYGDSTVIPDYASNLSIRTSKDEIIEFHEHKSLNYENPYTHVTEIVLIGKDKKVKKTAWLSGVKPNFVDSEAEKATAFPELISDKGKGTYEILYSGYNNGVNGPTKLVIDDDLNVISRISLDSNGYDLEGQSLNRASRDYDGNTYKYPFIDKYATNINSYNVFQLNNDGKYTNQVKLRSLESAVGYAKKLGTAKPDNWFEGLLSNTLVRGKNQEYIGMSHFYNHTYTSKQFYFLTIWDKDGNIKKIYEPNNGLGDSSMTFQRDISNKDEYYFVEYIANKNTLLKKLDVASGTVTTIKEYPVNTTINIQQDINNTYSFYGYAETFAGEINGYGSKPGLFVGTMTNKFNIVALSTVASADTLLPTNMISLSDGSIFLSGEMHGTSFADSFPFGGPYKKRVNSDSNIFFGFLKKVDDYSPIIKSPGKLIFNSDTTPNTAFGVNRIMLSGNLSGDYSDANAIKVYDNFDFNKSLDPRNQDWLNSRINRNPEKTSNPIDWKALGFDRNIIGPQNVTYFVSDSQKQISSTSRMVNVVTNQTIYNKVGALEARNFHIPLNQVTQLTDTTLRDASKYANFKAWDMETGKDIGSLPAAQGVEIDTTQLNAIRNTKVAGVFNLTFKLNYGDEKKSKTIKVFVGGEKVNDYVIYATDFRMPWDLSRKTSSAELLGSTYGKVEAYNISSGSKMDTIKVKDASVVSFKTLDPVSGEVSQVLPIQVIDKTSGNVLAESKLSPKGTVYYRYETVTVNFVDESYLPLYDADNKALTSSISLGKRIVGKPLVLANEATVKTEKTKIEQSLGYEFLNYFMEDKKTVFPIVGIEVPYLNGKGWSAYLQFKGILRFITVPKDMTFDSGKVLTKDQTLQASKNNASIFIGDNRKAADKDKGWRLYAKVSKQFTSSDNHVIPNILYYKEQKITSSNIEIGADKAKTKAEVKLNDTSGLNLKVPPGLVQKKSYSGSILWELTAAL